jgi:uncharacterized membrane protein
LVRGAIIAAIYIALTLAVAPVASPIVQFRVSEVLTVLPFLLPEAIPGLFIGCLLSNILLGLSIYDVVFGSAATLIAAFFTYKCRRVALAPLPPVLFNALIIGAMLAFTTTDGAGWAAFPAIAASVGLSELIICFGGGIPLLLTLKKTGIYKIGAVTR